MNSLLISIITVSYNAVNTIENTILSVINQVYPCKEYIIIDGGSTDGTVDIIQKYETKITYWVSESDKGIYDAMNKGVIKATGSFVFFLNSGDYIVGIDVLTKFSSCLLKLDNSSNVVFLGDIQCNYNGEVLGIVHAKAIASPWYTPPHQGMFISRQLIKSHLYDLRFHYLADREMLLHLSHNCAANLLKLDFVVSRYNLNGISSSNRNALDIFKEASWLGEIYGTNYFRYLIEYAKSFIKYLLFFFVDELKYFRILYCRRK